MGENLELDTGFRVLVVEERKESERLVKMRVNESFFFFFFLEEIGYSVSAFMNDGFNFIIVLWNVVTLKHKLQH